MTKVSRIHPHDPNRATISEELEALDWQVCELARLLTEVEQSRDETGKAYAVEQARRHLNALLQRSYRAQQIARGLKVPRA